MRKTIPIKTYTKINTNEIQYVFQNRSNYDLEIIVAAQQPNDNASSDFSIKKNEGISNEQIEGTCWGKPVGNVAISVGIVE